MTDKTFFRWIDKYAEAVAELSWIGSIEDKYERAEVKIFWTNRNKIAKNRIKQALDELVA